MAEQQQTRAEAPNPGGRFRVHMVGSGRGFTYEFLDHGVVHESGDASTPNVIWLLFEEFKRGRLSAQA
ncbi:hypothetical protein EBE87_20265 [Pseudoroseomonas wenyumeiae]|uniref:Uncharacterized protein n=1 Tax=Teichococcus wenyumeiae TaxID=2478470 RepID=A0A3A9JVI6_9PROT|nr:hypothetical protein [Pseudoroseomonas wenyumeiae]RKK04818.1 hypothetical protein D6Z83_07540 [Pseudoroseomonas wenyumeiae]RMI19486.1 hypothetical protein EBE87_20265 [Pseudoroseomonas wenyumeiae]